MNTCNGSSFSYGIQIPNLFTIPYTPECTVIDIIAENGMEHGHIQLTTWVKLVGIRNHYVLHSSETCNNIYFSSIQHNIWKVSPKYTLSSINSGSCFNIIQHSNEPPLQIYYACHMSYYLTGSELLKKHCFKWYINFLVTVIIIAISIGSVIVVASLPFLVVLIIAIRQKKKIKFKKVHMIVVV